MREFNDRHLTSHEPISLHVYLLAHRFSQAYCFTPYYSSHNIMAPPSRLAIATSTLQRLVKEEASYHKELTQQEARLEKLLQNKDDDENAEFQLKQERAAIEETKAILPTFRPRIIDAVEKLQDQLQAGQQSGASEEEVRKAKDVLEKAAAVTGAQ